MNYKKKVIAVLVLGIVTSLSTSAKENSAGWPLARTSFSFCQESEEVYYKKIMKAKKTGELDDLWKSIVADTAQKTDEGSYLRAAYNAQKATLLTVEGKADEAYARLQQAQRTLLQPFTFAYQMVAMMAANMKEDWALSKNALEQRRLLYMKELVLLEEKPQGQDVETYVKRLNDQMENLDIILADSYERTGENDKALFYAQKVIAKNRMVATGNELYTRLLERKGDSVLLYTELEDFVRSGKYTLPMKDQLEQLYKSKNADLPFETYFAGLEKNHLEAQKNQVKEQLINISLPDMKFLDVSGKAVSLSAFKGKTVILDFWATWCTPCIASFPTMAKARDTFAQEKKNVVFLFVNTAERGNDLKTRQAKLQSFIKGKPYTLDMLIDLDGSAGKQLKFESIPTKFIIDPQGNIRYRATGFNSNEKEAIEEMRTIIDLIS